MKTYFIKTFGCQMNELDSDLISGILLKRGLKQAKDIFLADLVIINTCSVRELAEVKAIDLIHRVLKKKVYIGVVGCMVNARDENLIKKFPKVNFFIGTKNFSKLDEILDNLKKNEQIVKKDNFEKKYLEEVDYFIAKRKSKIKAFVSIIRGCDNFCTYCIVPYTRGPQVSKDLNSIVDECKKLTDLGYKEITLLGQNVNSYGLDIKDNKTSFVHLLEKLNNIKDLQRIRFLTSHPKDISKELVYAIRDLDKVCNFLHFPMQAGSNRILKKMNRKYLIEEYLEKIDFIKAEIPGVTLGTDIIVGFPTETEDDFNETIKCFEKVKYLSAFIFAYSPRPKTVAAKHFIDDVPKEIKLKRLQTLLDLYKNILNKEYQSDIGKVFDVLVEKKSKRNKFLKGFSKNFKKIVFEGDDNFIGKTQKIKIKNCHNQTLIGEIF